MCSHFNLLQKCHSIFFLLTYERMNLLYSPELCLKVTSTKFSSRVSSFWSEIFEIFFKLGPENAKVLKHCETSGESYQKSWLCNIIRILFLLIPSWKYQSMNSEEATQGSPVSEDGDQRDAGKCSTVRETSYKMKACLYRTWFPFISVSPPNTHRAQVSWGSNLNCLSNFRPQWWHSAFILWKCHRYASLQSMQAPHGRGSDTTDPGGELWASWSSVDPPCHPKSAPLCRPQHRGLEDRAQKPGSAGTVGGELNVCGRNIVPIVHHWYKQGRPLFFEAKQLF